MGKKNKNKKKDVFDYFNLTPEEQMANANAFNDFEKGEVSLLDTLHLKVPNRPTRQSNIKKQIEEACFGISDDNNTNYQDMIFNILNERESYNNDSVDTSNETTTEYIPYSSIANNIAENKYMDETADVKETPKEEVKEEPVVKPEIDNIPRICFAYNSVVGRMLIDDGLITTPVSVCATSSIELNEDNIPKDSDALGTLLSKLYYFIIACKHPAVIMTEDTFKLEFSIYSKINFNKFVFFKNKGFVYAYVIDEGESDNFYSVSEILNMSDEDILRYVVGAAYASNTMHNVFMHEDEDEVESIMDERHSVKGLLNLINNDSMTDYAGHNIVADPLDNMRVTDLQTFIADVYSILDDLIEDEDDDDEDDDKYNIGKYDEDDEDDEEETDDDDDDLTVDDYPDIDEIDDEDDETSSIKNDNVSGETINHTSDSEIVSAPVFRRHS